ncbi:MAG: flagellar basal body P-ring protein FlgI [Syntrophales bacterium]
MKKGRVFFIIALAAFALFSGTVSHAARIKDIAGISGVRDNQLIGYGLVVGLAGTGDDVKNGFTAETIKNMLGKQGIAMRDKTIKADNVASVMVTAILPPFAKVGGGIDVLVSSLGNAKSLYGGTLLMTPLRGVDGAVYAIAQGAVVLGGFTAGGGGGSSVKNHPSAGRIAGGASVERQLRYDFEKSGILTLNLFNPDFTTASRLAAAVNGAIKNVTAKELDSTSVSLALPQSGTVNVAELVSQIENIDVPVDSRAVVVMNEKTGTVVMGDNVRISTVAVAHGNLSIQIKDEVKVFQPQPFAPSARGEGPVSGKGGDVIVAPGGQTVATTERTTTVDEEKKQLMVVQAGVTIQDVVRALNAVGVTPRDLITIMQTIKAAGALQADLKII